MARLPVDVSVGAGLRTEEKSAPVKGCGRLDGTGAVGACALMENCCHECLRWGPFRSMAAAPHGAEGTADLGGTVSGSFQVNGSGADSQLFFS